VVFVAKQVRIALRTSCVGVKASTGGRSAGPCGPVVPFGPVGPTAPVVPFAPVAPFAPEPRDENVDAWLPPCFVLLAREAAGSRA